MKAYVITIEGVPESEQAAERCIKTGRNFGVDVQHWRAITPADHPPTIFKEKNIHTRFFELDNKYSRLDRCMAAFLSHRSLWEECSKGREDFLILEHDAYFNGEIPWINGDIVSLGQPSYGKFVQPPSLGLQKLVSKKYFPGAHAYYMTPKGAQEALMKSHAEACPTDLYFHIDRFPNLMEFYPWPIEARDHFSTIQKESGCYAKHQYGPGYSIV